MAMTPGPNRKRPVGCNSCDSVLPVAEASCQTTSSIPTKPQQGSSALRTRRVQLRELNVRDMAYRAVNTVVWNRDRFSKLRQPRGKLIDLPIAGIKPWQTHRLSVRCRLVQRDSRNPVLGLESLVVTESLRNVQLAERSPIGGHHLCYGFVLFLSG